MKFGSIDVELNLERGLPAFVCISRACFLEIYCGCFEPAMAGMKQSHLCNLYNAADATFRNTTLMMGTNATK